MKKLGSALAVLATTGAALLAAAAPAAAAVTDDPWPPAGYRYHETFYGDSRYWKCNEVAYAGIRNGQWKDAYCRGVDAGWVDLYIKQ